MGCSSSAPEKEAQVVGLPSDGLTFASLVPTADGKKATKENTQQDREAFFQSILTMDIQLDNASDTGSRGSHAVVSIKSSAPNADTAGPTSAPRTPLDLICIFDLSGLITPSVETVKNALKFIRSQLRSADKLSIVVFDPLRVTLVHGFIKMTPANQESSEKAVDKLELFEKSLAANSRSSMSMSSKMIDEALEVALRAFTNRKSPNWNTACLLLTDGKDTHASENSKQRLLQRCKDIRAQCINFFTFAVSGSSFPTVQNIVANADSSLVFVDDDNFVWAIASSVGAQFSVVARNIKIYLAVGKDVAIRNVSTGSSIKAVAGSDTQVLEFQLNSLFIGESREILIRFTVPADFDNNTVVFTAGAVFTNIYGEHCSIVPNSLVGKSGLLLPRSYRELITYVQEDQPLAPLIKINQSTPTEGASPNSEVDAHIQRHAVCGHLERAIAWADARNFKACIEEIEDIRRKVAGSASNFYKVPMIVALLDDLQVLSRKMASEEAYFLNGGNGAAMGLNVVCSSQRAVFAPTSMKLPRHYQCLSSIAMQVVASPDEETKL